MIIWSLCPEASGSSKTCRDVSVTNWTNRPCESNSALPLKMYTPPSFFFFLGGGDLLPKMLLSSTPESERQHHYPYPFLIFWYKRPTPKTSSFTSQNQPTRTGTSSLLLVRVRHISCSLFGWGVRQHGPK